ncbi:MAG: hypothetical protein K2N47_00975, partial [Clostridia bacterium]|nr:hypothetical protein [Clostridia bacterium]
LYKMAAYGVQNGFSKCDDDIRELTKLIASLICGTSRKTVNLAKTELKRQQILKGANYLRKEINMDMVNQLVSNVNACITAAEAIASIRQDNEKLCGKLEESQQVLKEIKEALSNVADGTSKNAAEYQVKIFEALMDWRSAVSRYNCFTDDIVKLRGALDQAKEWQKLTATVRKQAKRNEDYYEYTEDMDDISFIVSAAGYAERTEGMREHLADFRKQTELIYSAEALRGELDKMQAEYNKTREEINNRLAEIKTESEETLIKYQNGEIDAISADVRVSTLEDEAADLNEQLKNVQEDFTYDAQDLKLRIRDAQSGSGIREKIAKNFEGFVNRLEAYRNTDPAMFVLLCSRINFNDVYDTMTGRLSDSEIEGVYVSVETIMRETEADRSRQKKNLKSFESIHDKMFAKRRQEERVLREEEEARRQKLREQRVA